MLGAGILVVLIVAVLGFVYFGSEEETVSNGLNYAPGLGSGSRVNNNENYLTRTCYCYESNNNVVGIYGSWSISCTETCSDIGKDCFASLAVDYSRDPPMQRDFDGCSHTWE